MAKHTSFLMPITMISNDGQMLLLRSSLSQSQRVSRYALDSGDHRASSPPMAAEHPCTHPAYLHPPPPHSSLDLWRKLPGTETAELCTTPVLLLASLCLTMTSEPWDHPSLGSESPWSLSCFYTPLFPGHKASSATQGHPFLSSQTPIN